MFDLKKPISSLTLADLQTFIRDQVKVYVQQALHMPPIPPPIPEEVRKQPLDFPVDDYGHWDEALSLRREDIYGDEGR